MRGVFNVDKPTGMTSSDVVVKVRGILRRLTGERYKVGHLGTLDPMATGVLPVTVGTATKLFDYLSGRTKTYSAVFCFGYETDTLDAEGKIIYSGGYIPTLEEVKLAANKLVGNYNQLPPAFSAKSVNGKRAYEYARKGQEVCLEPKTVYIESIFVSTGTAAGEYNIDVCCGSGTYIRAIGRDIASQLDTYATMTTLRRTSAVGNAFNEGSLVTIDELQNNALEHLISLEKLLENEKSFELPQANAQKVLNGIKLKYELPDGDFVVKLNGLIIAIGGRDADGNLLLKTRL